MSECTGLWSKTSHETGNWVAIKLQIQSTSQDERQQYARKTKLVWQRRPCDGVLVGTSFPSQKGKTASIAFQERDKTPKSAPLSFRNEICHPHTNEPNVAYASKANFISITVASNRITRVVSILPLFLSSSKQLVGVRDQIYRQRKD